jgi:hypothetical protein
MNKLAIKQIVSSKGWAEVLSILNDEIIESKLPKNYLTTGKHSDTIALECMAREKASKIVEKCIAKINRIANKQDLDKESWV